MRTVSSTLLYTLMLVMVTSAQSVRAEDLINQWYMQPTLQVDDDSLGNKTFSSQRIFLGQRLNKRINLEINLLSDTTDHKVKQQGIVIDGRYYLNDESFFNPYIAGGVSQLKDRQYNQLSDPMTNIGFGFEHTLKSNGARIHADVRYFMDDDNPMLLSSQPVESNDWSLRLGVSVPLTFDLFK